MNDLISRQAVIEVFNRLAREKFSLRDEFQYYLNALIDAEDEIKALPSAQRTGRWIVVSDGYGNGEATACICECSECKDTIWVYKKSDRKWKYCPNCGADMRGEQDEMC